MSNQLDFSKWGTITVYEDIIPAGQVIQFHPKDGHTFPMHNALVQWGRENNRDIGICIQSAAGWPVPCAIVFPAEVIA